MDQVTIYSDGGSDPNPGIGGWAAILIAGVNEKVLTGNAAESTNNRMELTAAFEALKALKRPCDVTFYTDSQYVRRGITEWIEGWASKGWKSKSGKPVQNVDLWQKLWDETKRHNITWNWVKGHAGNVYNERVDKLARQARLAITPDVELDENVVKIYLRGSCKGNPGPGGWGVVVEEPDGETEQNSGSEPKTTNNRMEIQAAIEGLLMMSPNSSVQLFTTSDYVFQGATKWIHGWRRRNWTKRDGKPVANGSLWQALDKLSKDYVVHWVNAKGEKIEALEAAGKLAVSAIEIV